MPNNKELSKDEIDGLEMGKDYDWKCICACCGKEASWYINRSHGLPMRDRWRWYCSDTKCSNDEHACYEDDIHFKLVAIDLREKIINT